MKRCFLFIALLTCSHLLGQPSHPTPIAGDITSITASKLVSTSHRSIVEWEDFSIDLSETFRMELPNASAAILNRVTGSLPSSIMGKLLSNGQVILINPNGIVVGNQGIIEVGAFIASTLDVTNTDFLKGEELLFHGNSHESIQQTGHIKALEGDVFLIARSVQNTGHIEASGTVGLGAGDRVIVRPRESELIVIDSGEGFIHQAGTIEAHQVKLQASGNPYALAINQEGLIEAHFVEEHEGVIHLVAEKGRTAVSGTLIAEGGTLNVLGNEVELCEGALLSAPEGNIHVGGGYQGQEASLINSQKTTAHENVTLFASSLGAGDGGTIVLWSDGETSFQGTAEARGGPLGGDGGLVEVSGLKNLDYRGFVDTSAPMGKTGLLLLDPTNITIFTTATSGGAFDGGSPTDTFVPTAATSNINIGDLNTALASNNVLVTTTTGFGNPGNITFTSGGGTTAITSPGNNLTFNADNNIVFARDTTFTDTVGTATFSFTATGNISNNGGDFVTCTDAAAFTWLAGDDITINENVTLTNTDVVSFTATSGTIDINDPIACSDATSCTFTAGTNITIDDDVTFTDVAALSFTATNNLSNGGGDTVTHTGGDSFSWEAGNNLTVGDNINITDIETVSFVSTGGNIDINDPIAVSGSNTCTIRADTGNIDIDDFIMLSGGSTTFTVEATTGVIRYSADVTTDAPTTTFRAPAASGDIIFDGGGDLFANPTTPGTVTLAAGRDINIDVDMDFEDTSGSQNVSFVLTAGRDFINQPPDNIDVRNADSFSVTAANDVTIQDPITITGTNTVAVEATGGAMTINGNLISNATTTSFSAPAGDITFSSAGGIVSATPTSPATFTFSAGNDIFITDDMTFNDFSGANNVSFIFNAGNDITDNPTFQQTFNNAGSVSWTADQDININDPFVANGVTTVNLTATNGTLYIFDTIDTNAVTTSLSAGTDIIVQSQVEVNTGTGGDLNVTAGNDIFVGGAPSTIVNRIGTRVGTLTINAGNDLLVSPGTGTNDFGHIGFSAVIVNSDIDITVGNNLTLTGGGATGGIALIGHGTRNPIGGSFTGDIILRSIGGDVTLTGGTGFDTFAQIGHVRGASGVVNATGDIRGPTSGTPAVISGSLSISAGTGNTAYAMIGHGGQLSAQDDIYSGEINIEANDITLTAGTNIDTFAAIGFYAPLSGTGVVSVSAGSEVHAISDTTLTLQGGTGTRANTIIGARVDRTGTGTGVVSLAEVEAVSGAGSDLSLLGGSTEAVIGAFVDAGTASTTTTTVTAGRDLLVAAESGIARIVDGFAATPGSAMTVSADRDAILTAGTGIAAIDAIDTLTMSTQTADILLFDSATAVARITAQNVSSTTTITAATDLVLTAANGMGAFIEVEDDDLIVRATNGMITVNADTHIENNGVGATATLTTFSGNDTFVRNNGFIRNDGSGLTSISANNSIFVLNDSFIEGMGALTVSSGTDVLILAGATGPSFMRGAGTTEITSGNNITLLGLSPVNEAFIETTVGSLTAIASKDIAVSSDARIENMSAGSPLTLVVDNQAPARPAVGNGMFSLSISSSLATAGGGPLRIFTARQSQNTILGTGNINGATFVPGTLFVDTATEVWNTYFPSSIGGTPFTVFYKDDTPVPPIVVISNIPVLGPNDLIGDYELYYMLDRIDRFYNWMWDFYIEERYGKPEREQYFIPHNKYLTYPRS